MSITKSIFYFSWFSQDWLFPSFLEQLNKKFFSEKSKDEWKKELIIPTLILIKTVTATFAYSTEGQQKPTCSGVGHRRHHNLIEKQTKTE